jgi:uncharacterized RmlC-like cupin family protein
MDTGGMDADRQLASSEQAATEPSGDVGSAALRPCRKVAADELRPADPTPGMTRRVGLEVDQMWSGTVLTDPGAASGWHHHGEHQTTLYVVSGRMRLEFGLDGKDAVDAGPGDFLHVPAGAIHRELNPTPETSTAVIVRCGTGPTTVNVSGPATSTG